MSVWGRLLLAVALPLALLGAAPVPAPAPRPRQVSYFPTTVGTKWVYQEGEDEHVEVITAVTEKDGAKLVTVGSEWKGEVTPRYLLAVSEKGIAHVAADVAELDEPAWALKFPHTPGKRWDFVLAVKGVGKWSGTATAGAAVVVEVPAGKFDAIPVECDINFIGERRRFTRWFAPDVGEVKSAVLGAKERVLKQFTRGK